MINATLRVRCISPAALEAITDLLREESNAIFIETFHTQEAPRTGTRAPIIRPKHRAGDRLGAKTRTRGATTRRRRPDGVE